MTATPGVFFSSPRPSRRSGGNTNESDTVIVVDLDVISYDEGLRIQKMIHAARAAGRGEDILLLLEHNPVVTFGKKATEEDMLVPQSELEAKGIAVRHVGRGGKITCHYPGQLVGYPIIRLMTPHIDIPSFVFHLEEMIIDCLSKFRVQASRIENLRGVWVDGRKMAAVGVEVSKDVTMHGFSLNVFEDNQLYHLFIPCGIADRGVTFLEHHIDIGSEALMNRLKDRIVRSFSFVFAMPITARLSWDAFEHRYPEMLNEEML